MTEDDIQEVKKRFINAAMLAEKLGLAGVQIRAAHGNVLSRFLSPRTNRRQDAWGGSLENLARPLTEIVRGICTAVNHGFSVSVKLNSADSQRGGFSSEDAKQVVSLLNPQGWTCSNSPEAATKHLPCMARRDGRTLAREAYFLEFAKEISVAAQMPIMVTGGIRRYPVVKQVLASGIDMIGMATVSANVGCLACRFSRLTLWMVVRIGQSQDSTKSRSGVSYSSAAIDQAKFSQAAVHQIISYHRHRCLVTRTVNRPHVAHLWE